MLVKKEFNQKKMELDIVQREYREINEKIKNSKKIIDSQKIEQFKKTSEDLVKKTQELEEFTKKYDEIKEQITQEQSTLHNIRKQQIEVEKELEEANSRLYNAKDELGKKDQLQDDESILTPSEKKFIEGESNNQKSSAGIIEAASAVVGSLKSKLNMTQKELETIQSLLEKEREEHEKTKQELKKLKKIQNP
jgi:TfoX/Sxy family transcriptional regulator of competence genes